MPWTSKSAIHANIAGEISAITEKASPDDADLVIIEDSVASNVKKKVRLDNLPGSGGSGSSLDGVEAYLQARQTGETSHADDDFFDDSSIAFTTELTVSGSATWTESRDVLSVSFEDQTGGDSAVQLKAIPGTPAAPITIETAFALLTAGDFEGIGLCFTDGTTASDNIAAVRIVPDFRVIETAGTLTNYAGGVNNASANLYARPAGFAFVRLIWTASNTFKVQSSPDGVSWANHGLGTYSKTMTPTHYGLFVSSQGASNENIASFRYFRVNESDLST